MTAQCLEDWWKWVWLEGKMRNEKLPLLRSPPYHSEWWMPSLWLCTFKWNERRPSSSQPPETTHGGTGQQCISDLLAVFTFELHPRYASQDETSTVSLELHHGRIFTVAIQQHLDLTVMSNVRTVLYQHPIRMQRVLLTFTNWYYLSSLW